MCEDDENDPQVKALVDQFLDMPDESVLPPGEARERAMLERVARLYQGPWVGYRMWFIAVGIASLLTAFLWNTIPAWSLPLLFAGIVGGKEIIHPTPPFQFPSPARRVRDSIVLLVDLGVIALCIVSIWHATGRWWGVIIGLGVAWLVVGFISPRGQGDEI